MKTFYQYTTFGTWLLLFPLLLSWQLQQLDAGTLSPTATGATLFVLLAPLLLIGPGLFKGHVKTYQWSLFLTLLYFSHGVMEAWAVPGYRWYALAEVALSLLWFMAAILYVRRQDTRGRTG